MVTLTDEQRLRHDGVVHRCQVVHAKRRRRWRIRVAMAARARLGFAVPRRRSR